MPCDGGVIVRKIDAMPMHRVSRGFAQIIEVRRVREDRAARVKNEFSRPRIGQRDRNPHNKSSCHVLEPSEKSRLLRRARQRWPEPCVAAERRSPDREAGPGTA